MGETGVCGLDFDRDKIYLSFSRMKGKQISFIEESSLPVGIEDCLIKSLQNNIESIRRVVDEKAVRNKIKFNKIFLKLPHGMEKMSVAEEVIALKRTKKIVPNDILFVKKYIEGNSIDWDDFCIHHFPLNFGVEGKAFDSLPVGFWTKRLRMKSLLVTIKDKVRLQVQDIFDNYDMPFNGFVSTGVSDFSAGFNSLDGVMAVINIGYEKTMLTIVNKGVLRAVERFDFGSSMVVNAIASEFIIAHDLADDIFDMYLSFSENNVLSSGKEVNIKDNGRYVKISMDKVNSMVKKLVKEKIEPLVVRLKHEGDAITVSFLGRLNDKEGFYDFLRSFIGYDLVDPKPYINSSSSFGCARYGVSRFLENIAEPKISFKERIHKLYKDYF